MKNPLKVIKIVSKVLIVFLIVMFAAMFFIKKSEYAEGTGEVVPDKIVNIYAPVDGEVEKIVTNFGDVVSSGDSILVISDKELEKQRRENENKIGEALGNMKESELSMKELERDGKDNIIKLKIMVLDMKKLNDDYEDLKFLVERGEKPKHELKKAEQAIKRSELEYEMMKANSDVENKKALTQQRYENYKKEYETCLENQKEIEELIINRNIVVKNDNMTVITKNMREIEGAFVRKGDILATLADINKLKMVVNLNEKQIGKVKKDQKVKIYLDSIPYERFTTLEGKVIKIYPQSVGESTYNKVEIEIGGFTHKMKKNQLANINLKTGLKGRARIIVSEEKMLVKFILDKMFE